MRLSDLVSNPPQLHRDPSGNAVFWGVSGHLLEFLDTHVAPGLRTLETGAGVSTLLFGVKGAQHICVVPDEDLVIRIKKYAAEKELSLSRVSFEISPSETLLPQLNPNSLDLVLIDGRHAFPTPFIDWYYAASALDIGGIVIVDDTHLWTGHVLKQFLLREPEWQLVADFEPRSVAFNVDSRFLQQQELKRSGNNWRSALKRLISGKA